MIGKAELLEAIAGKNRGLLASKTDKTAILAAVTQLEGRNPTPRPLEAQDLLDGNWRLLYTTSQELLNLDGFPLVQLGQIYQCVRTSDTKIYNIAELSGIPYLEGIVCVCARFEPVSQCRVNVRFERSIIGLQSFLSYSSANDFIEQIEADKTFPPIDFPINSDNQEGWLEVTYLDNDLRIGRGNQGSLFVLTKK